MNQSVTLFSEDINSVSKSQLLKIFETIEMDSANFFEQRPTSSVEVDYSTGNSSSFSLEEFRANFSSNEDFFAISFIFHFSGENHVSFYVSKNVLEPGYSFHVSATCNNKTRIEVREFVETVTEKINAILKPFLNSPFEQKTQSRANSDDINKNSKDKREQVKKILKLIGAITGFLASAATVISFFLR